MASSADVQIWNNAVFVNNGEISEDLTASGQSWGSLKSIFGNPKSSFDSVSDKENHCVPPHDNYQISYPLKSSNTPSFKHIDSDGVLRENVDSTKIKKIDEEIEGIESEIYRLKLRLEALRLEKAEMSVKIAEKRGRVVPAKFMDPIQTVKNPKDIKKFEEISSVSARTKVKRRGISLGPVEIISQRETSIGPKQISGKQELSTPIPNRRKSCFYKLQDISEEIGKSSSLSPKSRKVGFKTQVTSRQAVTTISTRKALKKDDSVILPKKLFQEGENPTSKKPSRQGRIVASRYNQNSTLDSAFRKRSFPAENGCDFNQKLDDNSKRALSVGKTRGVESSRVKKRWEIPDEIVVHGSSSVETEKAVVLLPRIKIARCLKESPRDSGPAKKVVELIGKKSFFVNDDNEVDPSVCQALTY